MPIPYLFPALPNISQSDQSKGSLFLILNPTKKLMGIKPLASQAPWNPSPHPKRISNPSMPHCRDTMPQNHNQSMFFLVFPSFPSAARLFPGRGAAPGKVSRLLAAFPAFSPPPPHSLPGFGHKGCLCCSTGEAHHSCPALHPEAGSSCSRFFPARENKDSMGMGSLLVVTQIPVM